MLSTVRHDASETASIADRIAGMNGGVIEPLGTPEAIYERPAFASVAQFVGAPTAALIEGMLRWSGDRAEFAGQGAAMDVTDYFRGSDTRPSGPAMLAIRPKHLAPHRGPDMPCLLTGDVDMVERTGVDSFVSVRSGTHLLPARAADGAALPAIGDHVGLTARGSSVSLFSQIDDPGSGGCYEPADHRILIRQPGLAC